MLIPSDKPLFENVSSREYYARAAELKDRAPDSCIYIVFPDFEEAIVFSDGKAMTAIHESSRWLAVEDDLLAPVENKAIAADGKMAAYPLSPGLLHVFLHKSVKSMVETELGPYLAPRLLIGYLENDKSTCILKLQDKRATGYVYFNFGKRVGAVYDFHEGRSYNDAAIKDMGRFREHTAATIYFMEFSEKYLKSKIDAKADAPPVTKLAVPVPVGPVEPAGPTTITKPTEPTTPTGPTTITKPATPQEPLNPFPAAKQGTAATQSIKPVAAKPAQAPKPAGVKLIVAMSDDRYVELYHRSRQQMLEALEENDVAWVDRRTLDSLHMPGRKASIVLPDGREYTVTLKEAAFGSIESRYIILPRKLRNRLSLTGGTMVEVKA